MARPKVKATSQKVTSYHASCLPNGTIRTIERTWGPRRIAEVKAELKLRWGLLLEHSTGIECETMQQGDLSCDATASTLTFVDVDISDACVSFNTPGDDIGDGEWVTEDENNIQEVYSDLTDGIHEIHHHHFIQRPLDRRMHRDHTERQNIAWGLLSPALVTAHLQWSYHGPPDIPINTPLHPSIKVMDLFASRDIAFPLQDHFSLNVTMARHGYIGNAPTHPSLAFSTRMLQLLQVLTARCPQLSLQSFVKSICDIHRVCSIYILLTVQLFEASYRQPLTRTSKSADKSSIEFKQNSSIIHPSGVFKMRVFPARRVISSERIEWQDMRTIQTDVHLNEEEVDWFKNEVKWCKLPQHETNDNELSTQAEQVRPVFAADVQEGQPVDGVDQPNPCVHAKYPLAVTNELLDIFGSHLLCGYDIGCGFSTTANNSTLVGPKLRSYGSRFCVGSFHGHAHCRTCQLNWHPLYLKGCGLEDFETCERVFSRSNALASVTCYASTFHRRQLIHRWFESWNNDKYADSSRFMYDNYVQALQNISTLSDYLQDSMNVLKIPSLQTFEAWHQAERDYLKSLKHEPKHDILRGEYLETLMKLHAADVMWTEASKVWMGADLSDLQGPGGYARATVSSQKKAVQDLEAKLEIDKRWEPGSQEWVATQQMIDMRKYQRAVDHLEGLVVARLMEISKAHQAGTGYKLRKHIGKALKSRSEAIHTAVRNYNSVAATLKPPRAQLDVQTVLDYVYLAQFDLLRESRHLLPELPWAQPAEREATTAYFKLARLREEVEHVNIEVTRLRMYMDDEEEYLLRHVERLQVSDPEIGHEILQHLQWLMDVNHIHRQRIHRLVNLSGFTGPRSSGVRKGSHKENASHVNLVPDSIPEPDEQEDDDESGHADVLADLDNTLQALTVGG
ncbi:hypothetical protein K439DRAFT_1611253 [Ramaria rubella]|nr:hypothetical protein K439DRAFT_1611253 [Ramaria rubella]